MKLRINFFQKEEKANDLEDKVVIDRDRFGLSLPERRTIQKPKAQCCGIDHLFVPTSVRNPFSECNGMCCERSPIANAGPFMIYSCRGGSNPHFAKFIARHGDVNQQQILKVSRDPINFSQSPRYLNSDEIVEIAGQKYKIILNESLGET